MREIKEQALQNIHKTFSGSQPRQMFIRMFQLRAALEVT